MAFELLILKRFCLNRNWLSTRDDLKDSLIFNLSQVDHNYRIILELLIWPHLTDAYILNKNFVGKSTN